MWFEHPVVSGNCTVLGGPLMEGTYTKLDQLVLERQYCIPKLSRGEVYWDVFHDASRVKPVYGQECVLDNDIHPKGVF